MNEWKRLDLAGKERPKPGRLVILYKRDITADRPGEYEAGRFFPGRAQALVEKRLRRMGPRKDAPQERYLVAL